MIINISLHSPLTHTEWISRVSGSSLIALDMSRKGDTFTIRRLVFSNILLRHDMISGNESESLNVLESASSLRAGSIKITSKSEEVPIHSVQSAWRVVRSFRPITAALWRIASARAESYSTAVTLLDARAIVNASMPRPAVRSATRFQRPASME